MMPCDLASCVFACVRSRARCRSRGDQLRSYNERRLVYFIVKETEQEIRVLFLNSCVSTLTSAIQRLRAWWQLNIYENVLSRR
jgi:hypothetical protein